MLGILALAAIVIAFLGGLYAIVRVGDAAASLHAKRDPWSQQ